MYSHLTGTSLFYPCSGEDWQTPIDLFAPHIQDFWFVDRAYFKSKNSAADKAPLLLKDHDDYSFITSTVKGLPYALEERRVDDQTGKEYPWLDPCILTECYKHKPSGKVIAVRRRRGFGGTALRKDINRLGVFFYRRDSSGDGGSGEPWLQKSRLREVLEKLINKGFVVTDGSNCPPSPGATYRELRHFHWNTSIGADAVSEARSFTDKEGRLFTCLAYVGEGYGPTLVWQVLQPRSGQVLK
jgi:hypothetical protein